MAKATSSKADIKKNEDLGHKVTKLSGPDKAKKLQEKKQKHLLQRFKDGKSSLKEISEIVKAGLVTEVETLKLKEQRKIEHVEKVKRNKVIKQQVFKKDAN